MEWQSSCSWVSLADDLGLRMEQMEHKKKNPTTIEKFLSLRQRVWVQGLKIGGLYIDERRAPTNRVVGRRGLVAIVPNLQWRHWAHWSRPAYLGQSAAYSGSSVLSASPPSMPCCRNTLVGFTARNFCTVKHHTKPQPSNYKNAGAIHGVWELRGWGGLSTWQQGGEQSKKKKKRQGATFKRDHRQSKCFNSLLISVFFMTKSRRYSQLLLP